MLPSYVLLLQSKDFDTCENLFKIIGTEEELEGLLKEIVRTYTGVMNDNGDPKMALPDPPHPLRIR